MSMKIRLTILSVISFFFFIPNVQAENNKPLYDSICCTPDSLRPISTNHFQFCVSWNIRTDSNCVTPQGFEIQWRCLSNDIWQSKYVVYTSGTTITFCDTSICCGTHTWRVRTKCNDSTYSDWVYGNKFTIDCGQAPSNSQLLSIAPNPAFSNILITAKNVKPGQVKLSIVNSNGKPVFEKTLITKIGNQIRDNISVSGWQPGIYFIRILSNGKIVSSGSFVKE